jgi:arylsulfatase A-like enzyme
MPSPHRPHSTRVLVTLLVGAAGSACGEPPAPLPPPNVLFVVWDTTRADHLSLYGYDSPTTPFLDRWAEQARVYEDCVSTGSSTVPSHGGMFTGLLPAEHGANNLHKFLDGRHETLAELFSAQGYRTYCFAANPHISEEENFVQGFDVEEHPWDPKYVRDALRIQLAKLHEEDESSAMPERIRTSQIITWDVKACGELAARGMLDWLGSTDSERPFFAFLNYMEAHRPFLPSMESRREFLTPEQIEVSLQADRGWNTMWSYTFGLHEYTPEEIEAMALTYDACIRDLDRLFEDLMTRLEAAGHLENTIVSGTRARPAGAALPARRRGRARVDAGVELRRVPHAARAGGDRAPSRPGLEGRQPPGSDPRPLATRRVPIGLRETAA